MLTRQILENALAFLARTQLAGNEVPAFCDVNNALQAELRKVALQEEQAAQPQATPQKPKR